MLNHLDTSRRWLNQNNQHIQHFSRLMGCFFVLKPCFLCFSKLSSCIEALQSILYPFCWPHTLIPILPQSLWEIVEAPTPFVCGVLSVAVVNMYKIDNVSAYGFYKDTIQYSLKVLSLLHCIKNAIKLLINSICTLFSSCFSFCCGYFIFFFTNRSFINQN